ncbi:hypothetical protein J2T02_005391 [Chitinophaga terrae (ex Kim and Jung 2007)]|nr:hypothetical protein [Chitinophaga terrae (ex Kim and Jung 2007)]
MINYLLSHIYFKYSTDNDGQLEVLFTSDLLNIGIYFDGIDFQYIAKDAINDLSTYVKWNGLNEFVSVYNEPIYIISLRQNFLGDVTCIKLSNDDFIKIYFRYDLYQSELKQVIVLIRDDIQSKNEYESYIASVSFP